MDMKRWVRVQIPDGRWMVYDRKRPAGDCLLLTSKQVAEAVAEDLNQQHFDKYGTEEI